ncbi:MAG: hypothetical protein ABI868_09270 [Acidobacteriota bacterium]
MRNRVLTLAASAGTIMLASMMSVSLAGQTPAAATKPSTAVAKETTGAKSAWTPLRTPWGHPDLRGVWDFQSIVPLERPAEFAGRDELPEQETVELHRRALERLDADRRDGGAEADLARAYNEIWYSRRPILNKRTSLVIDPPDGRVPPLTPAGQQLAARPNNRRGDRGTVAWTDELDSYTRCISRVMPRLPQNYNSGTQIFQAPDYVVLHYEQFDRRVIPLDGRPHAGSRIRQWNGDSRGHWEGQTLVVDTTNFSDKQEFRGIPQGSLHLIERFTRVDAKTINYEATIDDPTMWTRRWTILLPWQKDDTYQMFEYACHEGNLGMEGILTSGRVE